LKVIKKVAIWGLLLSLGALTACGGGGGSGNVSESGAVSGSISGPNGQVTGSAGNNSAADAQAQAASAARNANNLPTAGVVALNPDQYRATAATMGAAEGAEYRFGPSAADFGNNVPAPVTWETRKDNSFVSDQQGGSRKCTPGNCGTWQVGQWQDAEGDYSSDFGQVAYVPDDPGARVGVAGLAILGVTNAVFSQKPELSWTFYGGGLDEGNALVYQSQTGGARRPVAVANCNGRPTWCINPIMVFQGGLVGSAKANTATNTASVQLAPNKVPTAAAISNGNEFAFITVWDTQALRGEIAVVALAGLCSGCTPGNPGAWNDYWGEWKGTYPGLPNLGNTAYMKVLGYVPLPEGMQAPTAISVTTTMDRNSYLPAGGDSTPWDQDLSQQAVRDAFGKSTTDARSKSYARSGVAVVVSKFEQKVAFIDLSPLFQYYKQMYFGTQANYNTVSSVGAADNQWPHTFAYASGQTPKLLAVQDLAGRPTAVGATPWGSAKRAYVATQDGRLHIYNLGNLSAGGGVASGFNEVASVAVGLNPTHIAYAKEKAGNAVYGNHDSTRQLIVTSRGERKVSWVDVAADGNSAAVWRTLTDTRLVDPIATEDADNHATESYVLSVADYGGRALHNYRYGPVIMHGYRGSACYTGCGLLAAAQGQSADGSQYEYGGKFDLPGRPFSVKSSNVP